MKEKYSIFSIDLSFLSCVFWKLIKTHLLFIVCVSSPSHILIWFKGSRLWDDTRSLRILSTASPSAYHHIWGRVWHLSPHQMIACCAASRTRNPSTHRWNRESMATSRKRWRILSGPILWENIGIPGIGGWEVTDWTLNALLTEHISVLEYLLRQITKLAVINEKSIVSRQVVFSLRCCSAFLVWDFAALRIYLGFLRW